MPTFAERDPIRIHGEELETQKAAVKVICFGMVVILTKHRFFIFFQINAVFFISSENAQMSDNHNKKSTANSTTIRHTGSQTQKCCDFTKTLTYNLKTHLMIY